MRYVVILSRHDGTKSLCPTLLRRYTVNNNLTGEEKNMRRNSYSIFTALLLMAVLLSACAPAPAAAQVIVQTAPPVTIKETVPVQQTVVVTQVVSYTHLRAHETRHDLVCRLLLEKQKN